MRAEKTPRLSFAMFQVPISSSGHFLNINSGGGGLSAGLITSISKNALAEPPYYLYSAFEQGNGAAVEVGGPLDAMGKYHFRAFAAGGSGNFSGNAGGRYFADDHTNYTYGFGGQIKFNLIGYYDRFDSPMLYTKVPTTLAALIGAKYDQRAVERYPAANAQLILRTDRFIVAGETYGKRELEFESNQFAYNVAAGVLLWEKNLYLAADFGAFIAGSLDNPPQDLADAGAEVRKQRDEQQARGALHFYFYENIGVLTALYRWRDVKSSRDQKDGYKESEARLIAQYRF
jgi:hypothetical protein